MAEDVVHNLPVSCMSSIVCMSSLHAFCRHCTPGRWRRSPDPFPAYYNIHHATDNTQRANMQRATDNTQRATDNVQHTTRNRHCTERRALGSRRPLVKSRSPGMLHVTALPPSCEQYACKQTKNSTHAGSPGPLNVTVCTRCSPSTSSKMHLRREPSHRTHTRVRAKRSRSRTAS